eukprot:Protomagalhaensia_wolfi_Nauph_80__2880@NODE_2976_length_928_cov_815_245219_g2333_i0_p1_GENE_NODE_2976_length_928_cov_815_245219_g2333_i0NODE_2976_length_928_cov_815_245219_g2333_i0_p1_ORF_typecomplete_len182_score52_12Elf1/PF05129_13/1_3e23Rubredoxin/PF00301_20/0_28Rubredoxin/PF00301_20/4_NODE_2976_length_928_cov_815_245219_g2333_i0363908
MMMGKREPRRRAPIKAPLPKLDSEFDCPFCAALKSVQVQIKKRELIAQLQCRACLVEYQTAVGPLDEPVDVFSLWIDSCEEVNSPRGGGGFLPAIAAKSKRRRLEEDEEVVPPPSRAAVAAAAAQSSTGEIELEGFAAEEEEEMENQLQQPQIHDVDSEEDPGGEEGGGDNLEWEDEEDED